MDKLFSKACERNKAPILEVIKTYLRKGRLLEIGSGTGQHAVFFAEHLPDIQWVTSDQSQYHPSIKSYAKEARLKNLHGPELLKIGEHDFPKRPFDYVFSANTLHIMSWKECKTLFKLLGKRLREGSVFFIYGPFNYKGEYTSESNKKFDLSLKSQNPQSGIRNYEDVLNMMTKAGFKQLNDHEMPANNRLLVFERLKFSR